MTRIPPCEWQLLSGRACGKPSAARVVLTPIPNDERWAETETDLCVRHVNMAKRGRCEAYRFTETVTVYVPAALSKETASV